jgi:hypothetical protein
VRERGLDVPGCAATDNVPERAFGPAGRRPGYCGHVYHLISIQPGPTAARAYTAPPKGETVRYRLTGLLQETVTPWAGALLETTLPVRLLADVLLTENRLLFSGKFWIPRTPSRLWAINDGLVGGSNYAQRAAQFVERRDVHAVGHCDLNWISAVQLERPDTAIVNAGTPPGLGFVTARNDSASCVSLRPLDTPSSPWSVYLEQAQWIVRCVASARSRHNPDDDTLRGLMDDARYESSALEAVGWVIPHNLDVPTE